MSRVFVFSLVFFLAPTLWAIDPQTLLKKIDELYRSKGSIAEVEMVVETPHWTRTMKMKMWTKGLDYTFVRLLNPRKDKGVGSLKRKNEMWNFFPKINKVIKVPPSMMMGSWMGSDFTNDDLVKNSSLVEDYNMSLEEPDSKNYKLILKPKKDTVSLWGQLIVFVDKKSLLPTSQEFYDEKNKKVRLMKFTGVKTMGGRQLPSTMELIPLTKNKKGHKTLVRYLSAQFDVDIPMSTFTRTNLQKRR